MEARQRFFRFSLAASFLGFIASLAGACPPAGQSWSDVSPSSGSPPGRWDHALAYDFYGSNVLMFGGANGPAGQSVIGDTWSWNGTSWSQHLGAGPGARRSHAMTYDSQRRRVVLFGGFSGAGALRDTWEWDGVSWTHRSNAGPIARWGHSMVYDPARGKTIMFGGFSGSSYLPDTWEWDGNSWTFRANTGPSARSFAAMAYDTDRYRLVLFGGHHNGNVLGDMWEWNGSSWSQLNGVMPHARYAHSMAFCVSLAGIVMHGGYNAGNVFGDTWVWNGSAWRQLRISSPPSRWVGAMTYDQRRERLVLFGGAVGGTFDDRTWEGAMSLQNDDCAGAIAIAPGSTAVDNTCATNNPAPNGCADLRDVWFEYTSPVSSTVTVSVSSIFFTPIVGVYQASSCAVGAPVSCTTGAGVNVSFAGSAGSRYLIKVGSWNGAAGTGTLRLSQQPITCPPQIHPLLKQQKLYYIVGTANNVGWSWCIRRGANEYCDYNVPGVPVGQSAAAIAARFVQSINDYPCPQNTLNAQQLTGSASNYFRVTLGGNIGFNLCVGAAGSNPTCCMTPYTFCSFNPDITEIELSERDCNANGEDDTIDILQGTSADANGNGVPDECDPPPPPPLCPCDVNNDGRVRSQDFFDYLGVFFESAPGADVNRDGLVNTQDFFEFLGCFFRGCGDT